MANKTLAFSAAVAVLAAVQPGSHAAGAISTPWLSMAEFKQIAAVISVGTLGAGATIDAKLEQATDDAGADAKDIEGMSITQLEQAEGDDDVQTVINCHGEDLDLKGKFAFVRLTITGANASSAFSALVLGTEPRVGPASEHNAASVAEIVPT